MVSVNARAILCSLVLLATSVASQQSEATNKVGHKADREVTNANKADQDSRTERKGPRKYLHDGKWLTKYEIVRSRFERRDGQWRARDPKALERERARNARAKKKLDRKVKSDLRLLASSYSKTRAAAKKRLLAVAEKHGRPELAKTTNKQFTAFDNYWRAYWRARRQSEQSFVTIGVNAQLTRLEGIDTVPVSFGRGGSGRLQLPRTRSVSIGSTVVVPAGR